MVNSKYCTYHIRSTAPTLLSSTVIVNTATTCIVQKLKFSVKDFLVNMTKSIDSFEFFTLFFASVIVFIAAQNTKVLLGVCK